MKRFRLVFMILMLMVILFSTYLAIGVSAAGNQTKYDYPKDNFSIQLPGNWREMPKEVIVEYVKNLHAKFPNTRTENYNYGFQLKSSKNWFEYPYILIQIKDQKRISACELKQLKQIDNKQVSNHAKNNLGNIVSNVNFNEMVYDSTNQIVWMRLKLTVQGIGDVVGICGMCLTEQGWIQVNCYCKEGEAQAYQRVYQNIIRSVKIAGRIKYRG